MGSKRIFLSLLAPSCAAALMLAASATSGQSTPQTSPSTGGGMMTTPMGGGMMTSPGTGMSTTPYTGGGAMEMTPGTTGYGARGGAMGRSTTGGGMMAQMEESNRRLDELVSTMNSATGSAKVDAIAAVVNELVSQHRQMHEHMMSGRAGAHGGKRMMGTHGTTSTTPGSSTTPRASRRHMTGGRTTSPAVSPTPMP